MSEKSAKPIADYQLRTTGRLPLVIVILLAANVGLGVIFWLLTQGVHFIIVFPVFLTLIYGVIYILIQRASYRVYEDGLEEVLAPFTGKWSLRGSSKNFYRWDDLEHYTEGGEMTRGLWERPYLKLKFKGQKMVRLYASFQQDVAGFVTFKEKLMRVALDVNRLEGETMGNDKKLKLPVRRKNFYERPIGKVVTVFFMLVTAAAIALAIRIPEAVGVTSAFRILFLLIPGTLYMMYKSFGRRE